MTFLDHYGLSYFYSKLKIAFDSKIATVSGRVDDVNKRLIPVIGAEIDESLPTVNLNFAPPINTDSSNYVLGLITSDEDGVATYQEIVFEKSCIGTLINNPKLVRYVENGSGLGQYHLIATCIAEGTVNVTINTYDASGAQTKQDTLSIATVASRVRSLTSPVVGVASPATYLIMGATANIRIIGTASTYSGEFIEFFLSDSIYLAESSGDLESISSLNYTVNDAQPKTPFQIVQDKVVTMTGATLENSGISGLVPVPAAGDQEKFLRGDGTWVDIVVEYELVTESMIDELDLLEISETAYNGDEISY